MNDLEPNLRVRAIEPCDYDDALRLWSEVPGVRGLETREQFERILARNPELGSVAIEERTSRLVGALLCTHDGRRGYLYHLAVAEEFRRRGIARAMVTRSLLGLGQAGISRCSIFLIHDNEEGAAFWLRNGWRERIDLRLMAIDLESMK